MRENSATPANNSQPGYLVACPICDARTGEPCRDETLQITEAHAYRFHLATTAIVTGVFDAIIASWDEPLRCQTEQSPRPCRNGAVWLGVDHECRRVPLCTFHKNRWLARQLVTIVRGGGDIGCPHCDRRFATPWDRVSFTRV